MKIANYIRSGYWSNKSIDDAEKQGNIHLSWDCVTQGNRKLPQDSDLHLDPNAAFLHYVSNETVEGLQFHRVLSLDSVPRICDMSSDFLSRPIDVKKYRRQRIHPETWHS